MNAPVIIKGNKQGIRLIISNDACLYEIIHEIKAKLKITKNYYTNVKPIDVTFEGKVLTEDEKDQILDTLRNIGLNIAKRKLQLIPHPNYSTQINNYIPTDEAGLFFKGTIRSGQSLECTKSIVIIGDVLKGASVISEGNVIVIGNIYGNVIAGSKGDSSAFVYCI